MKHNTSVTCKHNPIKRVSIGFNTQHGIYHWRCACGKILALTDLQIKYVAVLQLLLSKRESGTLSDEQEGEISIQLNDIRNEMAKCKQEQLEAIVRAVVNS
jgi:hypothetical protein